MIDPHALRRLAVLNVIAEKIGKEIRAAKTEIGTALGRGSMTAFATPGDPNSEIGGGEVPGVEIPAPGKPVASFKQTAEAESQIEAMLERGEIRLFEDVFAEAVQQ